MWFFSVSILLVSLGIAEGEAKSWFAQGDRGWLWYKEEPIPLPRKENTPKPSPSTEPSPTPPEKTYAKQIENLRIQFEEALSKAILIPSLENVRRSKTLHDQMLKQSEEFSKLWVLASLMDKGAYQEASHPNTTHQRLYREQQEQRLIQKIKALTKTYGLFFVFKQDCPYCHEFAPIVMQFVESMGFEFKAISGDGGTIRGLRNISKDNGALKVINPEGTYPALFLANPKTNEVIPVARGLVSWSHLLENFGYIIESFIEIREAQHGVR